MAHVQPKSSPRNELCSALPSLPVRLQEGGAAAKRRLEDIEARLAVMSEYVVEKG
jgi:hypothetical protein